MMQTREASQRNTVEERLASARLVKTKREMKASTFSFLLTLPSLIGIVLVSVIPIIILIVISFYSIKPRAGGLVTEFIGLENYKFLYSGMDPDFWPALGRSFVYMSSSVFISFIIGLAVALVLNTKIRFVAFFRGITLLPWAMPIVVSAFIWRWILDSEAGILNDMLLRLDIIQRPIVWLGTNPWAMISVIASDIWIRTPLIIIVLLATLQTIPEEYMEAAMIDGASAIQRFRHIMVPFMLPSVFFLVLISSIFAFRTFALGFLLTGGGPGHDTYLLVIHMYNTTYSYFEVGRGAALSMTMFFAVVIITVFWSLIFRSALRER
jgi:multiple sugar transport system permease protein